MKAKFKLILGRRKNYPLHIDLEVYKGADCRVFVSTGIVLESAKQWDPARQIVVKHTNAEQYNTFMHGIIENIETAEKDADEHNRPFNSMEIKAAAKNLTSFESVDVIETFNRYVEKEECKANTRKGHKYTMASFCKFIKEFKGIKSARLPFSELNYALIVEYDKYLNANTGKNGSTAFNYHMYLRKLSRKAKLDGLIRNNPYDDFNLVKGKSTRRPSLTTEQLVILENIDRKALDDEHISEVVLDIFLFSCYTGLRYSDVSTLLKSELRYDKKGMVLERKTQKTGTDVVLPLYMLFNGKAQRIAEKYIKEHEDINTLFPSRVLPIVNKHLLSIEKFLHLPFHLTFHVARHTCASQLAELADNPFVIMQILGHGSIHTSMRYIHRSHRTSEKKLAEVDWSNADDIEYPTNEETLSIYNSIIEACNAKRLSPDLTNMAVGAAMSNYQMAGEIAEWINGLKKTDYTMEAWGKRLEMLVG